MKTVILLLTFTLLTGCATVDFTASKRGVTKGQISSGALLGESISPLTTGDSADNILGKSDGNSVEKYITDFKRVCESSDTTKATPLLIPLISAIPKLLYDISIDKTNKELEALKKSSSSSYSVDFVLKKGDINKYKCLLVMRHDKKDVVSATIGYKINIKGELVYLEPKFIWAKNTVANTREVEKGKKEEITIMSGLSLQGIGVQKNGIPILVSSGQDSKKIGKLHLSEANVKLIKSNVSIGPIPLIKSSSVSILRVSVTEVGDIGYDIDEKIAANKTIKEAIGPALAEGVKGYLEK